MGVTAGVTVFQGLLFLFAAVAVVKVNGHGGRPAANIVLFMTDDLDSELGGMTPLAKTRKWIGEEGVTFTNSFVNTPVCCPSRSSILTGIYQHNTQVLNNSVEGNCYGSLWRSETEKSTFGAILQQEAGYQTFYAGKYLNKYGHGHKGHRAPPGWDWWAGLLGNSRYYNYTLSIDGKREVHGDDYANDYLTDVIGRKADMFLDRYEETYGSGSHDNKHKHKKPFLMVLSTPSPHAPFTPAPQYADRFQDVKAPRTPAFNYVHASNNQKHWFLRSDPKPLNQTLIDQVDEAYRNRWRTLLSVDDLVDGVMKRLESMKVLDNTYVIFTSDHGYHFGTFALTIDKRQPYETDIRVPLMARGPGIKGRGQQVSDLVVNIDLAPTLVEMGGLDPKQKPFDGLSFLSLMKDEDEEQAAVATAADEQQKLPAIKTRDSFLVEYNGEGNCQRNFPTACLGIADLNMCQCAVEWGCKCQDSGNNTYTCWRQINEEKNVVFCQFADNENFVEVYDLNKDNYQLDNVASEISSQEKDEFREKIREIKAKKTAVVAGQEHQKNKLELARDAFANLINNVLSKVSISII